MKPNYIAGKWKEAEAVYRNINPSDTGDCIDAYAIASADDVSGAVEAAKHAHGEWSLSTPQQRFSALDFIGTEIHARKDELGRLLAREEGKTLPEATGEVVRAGQIFKFFAGEAVRNSGEHIPSVRPGVEIDTFRQPIGVVALITPWNFPIAIPAWKTAPALAFGNTVVLKPAELTPGCAWALAEIISRSGIPKGAFNLIMGKGSIIGDALVNNHDVAGVSFTGSIGVGRSIAKSCADRLAKVQLEMGGKNPLVVLDDAEMDVAVSAAVNGAYFSTGQRCTASSRLVVTAGIHDRFVAAMVEKMKSLKVDDALTPGTDIGPVVDETQLQKNLDYVGIGKKEGAKLLYGGQRLKKVKVGYYMTPALFTDTNNTMQLNRDEIFGPVASVVRVRDYEEALAVANDTPFGLTSGICTTSLKYASHYKMHAESGMVMVNLPTAGVDYHVPFGGRKGSSYGSREQGRAAAEFYTTVKTCYTAP